MGLPRELSRRARAGRAAGGVRRKTLRTFGTSEPFWLNLQVRFELEVERDRVGARIARDVPVLRKAGRGHAIAARGTGPPVAT